MDNLTEQAKRKFIDRRSFMKGAMALGLTATSALLLFQACGGDEAPTTVAGPTATRERLGPTLVPTTPADTDTGGARAGRYGWGGHHPVGGGDRSPSGNR